MVQEVHHNDLTAALAAPVAVLDFNATWCGPCKMLGPVLEEVSNEMADKAAFFGIDCDENPQLAAQFGVSSIPCLVVLKRRQDGHPSGRLPAETGAGCLAERRALIFYTASGVAHHLAVSHFF